MLVTKNSRGHCADNIGSKHQIEHQQPQRNCYYMFQIVTTCFNIQFHIQWWTNPKQHLSKTLFFMNFRKVIKDAMCCMLTNEVLIELDEEMFIRNYGIEKSQENAIIKKLFNGCQPITRRQKWCSF